MALKKIRAARERDPDQTRKLLLDAAASVLRNKGYTFFTADQIAHHAGVDPRLIKHYYGSVNGLLKMLIHENDFWLPVLETFREGDDLKSFIKRALKSQLDYFLEHQEMQRFILWQFSEYNAVISSAASIRENAGRRILDMCRKYFNQSFEEFELTVGLIVSGIYGIVLQTITGNCLASGFDIRVERDRARLYKVIDRIIELEWDIIEERRDC